jgi:hypothetical protein
VDVKTLFLLGIGMLVLLLVGIWAARARSAELVLRRMQPHEWAFAQPDTSITRLPGYRRPHAPPLVGRARAVRHQGGLSD